MMACWHHMVRVTHHCKTTCYLNGDPWTWRDKLGDWLTCKTGYAPRGPFRWRWVNRLAERWDPYGDPYAEPHPFPPYPSPVPPRR